MSKLPKIRPTINSRAKGAAGEREFAQVLKAAGWEARRGQQFAGGGDSPDVVTDVPGVHFEVKRVDGGFAPYKWMKQAARDAAGKKTPVVAHRKNREDWLVILRVEDFLDLMLYKSLSD